MRTTAMKTLNMCGWGLQQNQVNSANGHFEPVQFFIEPLTRTEVTEVFSSFHPFCLSGVVKVCVTKNSTLSMFLFAWHGHSGQLKPCPQMLNSTDLFVLIFGSCLYGMFL